MRPRAETAGCEQSIFFNNAGASLQPRALVARVIEYLPLEEQAQGATRRPTVWRANWSARMATWTARCIAPRKRSRCRRTPPLHGKWPEPPRGTRQRLSEIMPFGRGAALGMFFLNALFLQAEGPDVVP
jgi:hypothetical protein